MATITEVAQVLELLAAMYPHGPQLTEAHFKAFHAVLSDVPVDVLQAAAISLGSSNKFFPSAAELRTESFSLVERVEGEPCPYLAWDEVMRSVKGGGHTNTPEWSQPIIGTALRAIGGFTNVCMSTNIVAERARFIEAYTRLVERARTQIRTPPAVRDTMLRLGNGFGDPARLTSGDNGRQQRER